MIAVILAGGSGTRFWPVSRRSRPKQLVELYGGKSMLEQTVDRLAGLVGTDETFIVCGADLEAKTRKVVPALDTATNFIIEPAARNTAPAIALAALHAQRARGDEVMVVLPSDHYVRDVEAFKRCLKVAADAAVPGRIVTLGIEPTRPETGYGYIEFSPDDDLADGVSRVKEFVEKPDAETAVRYFASGEYLWNAGIFLFRPQTLFDEIERQHPELHQGMQTIADADDFEATVEEVFPTLPSISIDYAVMEGATDVAVVPADVGWSDVGHWAAVDAVVDADPSGNRSRGENVLIDVTNSVVFNDAPGVAGVIGMDGVVVVRTDDALLVVPRERAQDVRAIVAELKRRGLDYT